MTGMTVFTAINRSLMGLAFLPGLGDPLMTSQTEGGIGLDQKISLT